MRLDTRTHRDFPRGWQIWHATWMEFIHDCVVVDNGVNEFIHLVGLLPFLYFECHHTAKCIHIDVAKKFVVIDPIADDDKSQELDFVLMEELIKEPMTLDGMKVHYKDKCVLYSELVGTLYPSVVYNEIMMLRRRYQDLGGDISELPLVRPPRWDGRTGGCANILESTNGQR